MQDIVFQTVVCAVLIFVLKELLQEFVFSPIKKYKKIIGEIDNRLKYYSNIITNSGIAAEDIFESSKIIRSLSCDLESAYKQIPFKSIFLFFEVIQARDVIYESAKSLIYISNAGGKAGREVANYDEITKVRKNLKIPEL